MTDSRLPVGATVIVDSALYGNVPGEIVAYRSVDDEDDPLVVVRLNTARGSTIYAVQRNVHAARECWACGAIERISTACTNQ